MIKKRDFGNIGEEYAAAYLVNQGYTILFQNWTVGHKEIDIIALHQHVLVFIEVKTRRSSKFGNPEESVNDKKAQAVVEAAQQFMSKTEMTYKDIRFDIIAIILNQGQVKDFLHIQDAFY